MNVSKRFQFAALLFGAGLAFVTSKAWSQANAATPGNSDRASLNFSSIGSGSLSPPAIGGFRNGRGEFFNQETLNGKTITVRFVISDITPTSCRFEQSFSDDGGKTWEVNWIATDTRA